MGERVRRWDGDFVDGGVCVVKCEGWTCRVGSGVCVGSIDRTVLVRMVPVEIWLWELEIVWVVAKGGLAE